MVKLERIVLLAVGAIGLYFLYMIAMAYGVFGLVFDLIVLGFAAVIYWKRTQAEKLDAVDWVYKKQIESCLRNKNPNVKFLVMTGDFNSQNFIKGRVIGGPINRYAESYNKKRVVEEKKDTKGKVVKNIRGEPVIVEKLVPKGDIDPRAKAITVLYTQRYGFWWDMPVLGGILRFVLRDNPNLMTIYRTQLISEVMRDNILVKGTNTYIRGKVEFVNDLLYQDSAELQVLKDNAMNETLEHYISNLPNMMDDAVASDPTHTKGLQNRGDVIQ